MERKTSKKQTWLKQVRLTKGGDLYVGIDARKLAGHLCEMACDNGASYDVLR